MNTDNPRLLLKALRKIYYDQYKELQKAIELDVIQYETKHAETALDLH